MSVTISGSGQIIKQVIQTVKTDTFSTGTSGSWVDITGLSVAITPTNANNKILVSVMANTANPSSGCAIRITRNGTAVGIGTAGSGVASFAGSNYSSALGSLFTSSGQYMDSPATTLVCTYQVQIYGLSGTSYVNRDPNGNTWNPISSIVVSEVAYA